MIDNKIIPYAVWLCKWDGNKPHHLEPGDEPHIDEYTPEYGPKHYMWREYTESAKELMQLSKELLR